jgi:meso-butanediol dehydrogenase/(S,S)-butanediol dehydrogenase/diacetyl reductase
VVIRRSRHAAHWPTKSASEATTARFNGFYELKQTLDPEHHQAGAGKLIMKARMIGKTAIVTGGGGGIGGAVGELFCDEGAAVLLVDRDEAALARKATAIRERVSDARIEAFVGDISDYNETVRAVETAVARFGHLNVVVNNAAIRDAAPLENARTTAWNDLIDVNLLGAVNLCNAAIMELRKDGKASIVNVSSVYGVMARKHWGVYDATKAALLSLTRTLACEEAENGIRANSVCVASTLTPHTVENAQETRDITEQDLPQEANDSNLLHRWAQPIEIAYPILWLASDEASFITGSTLMADAGRSII